MPYDNVFAESVNWHSRRKGIQRKGPWPSLEAVEFATLACVHWFNAARLLESIDYVPPAEHEVR